MKFGLREVLWSLAVTVILVVRLVSTLSSALLIMGWIVVAFGSGLWNAWFWPAVISGALLALSTFLYNLAKG